jgi:ketosteroid isomerase-like protein
MNHDQLLRGAYDAFARGDLDGYLACCAPAIKFTVPGAGKVAGVYDRDAFKTGLIARVMELTQGSFRETVLDVFTSDRGGVVHAAHEFERNGQQHSYRTFHHYDILDGKLASFREVPEDLVAFDRAWS